ncbi:MAG TPA: phosphatase PAP2-related protein [Bacteroidia bacterium]|nr:phosphatase PAP2-related protein [Bacteroidia bacterium]
MKITSHGLKQTTWEKIRADASFRKQLLISFLFLAVVLAGFFFVLAFVENRDGLIIEKGWLDGIASTHDFSAIIFPLTYSTIIAGVIIAAQNPEKLLLMIRAYAFLQLLRGISLLVFPLDPPGGIIPLHDPFLQSTFYNGRANLKDLFFSGHVATIVMFIPVLGRSWLKYTFALSALAVGILLVVQRAHYVADVAAAPLFSGLSFWLASSWTSSSSKESAG